MRRPFTMQAFSIRLSCSSVPLNLDNSRLRVFSLVETASHSHAPRGNVGAQHQGIHPFSIAAAVISRPAAIRNEAQSPIKRERGLVVLANFQEHRRGLSARCFSRTI